VQHKNSNYYQQQQKILKNDIMTTRNFFSARNDL